MDLVFMGTPAFARPTLETLLEAGHRILAVCCQPDRPAGRGRRVEPGPVKSLAEERGLPLLQPERLRGNGAIRERLVALAPEAMVVAAYGLILPPEILAIPPLGCINLHASLLPRFRGASPVQHALLAGELGTGVTTMLMDRGMDTGPILLQQRVEMGPRETAISLAARLAEIGAPLVVRTLSLFREGELEPLPQREAEATYAPLLRKDDGWVRWDSTAEQIDRRVRALQPWPGSFTLCGNCRIRLLETLPVEARAEEEGPADREGAAAAPGEVLGRLGRGILVACGGGTRLQVLALQPEGRAAMDGLCCLSGRHVRPGDRLRSLPGGPAERTGSSAAGGVRRPGSGA